MARIGFLLLVLVLLLSLDWYAFSGLKPVFGGGPVFTVLYWLFSLFVVIGFFKVVRDFSRKSVDMIRAVSTNLLLGLGFAILVGKIVFTWLDDIIGIGSIIYCTCQKSVRPDLVCTPGLHSNDKYAVWHHFG